MSLTLIQTDRFTLSEAERQAIEQEKQHFEDPRAVSIEALKIVQQQRGWVPDGACEAIGALLGIPASDVEGVATFYSQIFRVPVGRHILRVCDSMTCFIAGHETLLVRLRDQLGIEPFFCDPRAPWQKGGVENAIGRLRRSLPRKTDLHALPDCRLDDILAIHNHTPRKCLGFQTPAEAFTSLLHFQGESTPGSSPG